MAYFAFMIEARDLKVRIEESNSTEILGCFCTRYIKDNDNDKAKETVQSELISQGIACSIEQIVIDSVQQLDELPKNAELSGSGFTFYKDQ